MKIGAIITGIVLLIIGASVYGYLQTSASDCASFVGQLGRAFSSNVAERCQIVSIVQIFGIILGVIGLGVLIYGAAAKGTPHTFTPEPPRTFTPENDETEDEKNIRRLGILKERLARGEITKEEYDKLKDVFD